MSHRLAITTRLWASRAAQRCFMACGAILLLGISSSWGQNQPRPEAGTLLERYREAVGAWDRAFSSRVKTQVLGTHPDLPHRQPEDRDITFRRDGNRFERFGRIVTPTPGGSTGNKEGLFTLYDKGTLYSAGKYPGKDTYQGDLIGRNVDAQRMAYELAAPTCGGYLFGYSLVLAEEAAYLPQFLTENAKSLAVVSQDEIDGVTCHVIEENSAYGTVKLWIAPDKGYNAMKITISKKSDGPDLLRGGVRMQDTELAEVTVTYGPFRVEQMNGTFYPLAGDCTTEWVMKDKRRFVEVIKAECRDIDWNPDFEALGAFTLTRIEGAVIRDAEFPAVTYAVAHGKLVGNVDDVIVKSIEREVKTLQGPEVVSATVLEAAEAPRTPREKSPPTGKPPATPMQETTPARQNTSPHRVAFTPILLGVLAAVCLSWVAWRRLRTKEPQ